MVQSKEVIKIDYEGSEVSFSEKGWFNATVVAARFGKDPHEWLRLPSTQQYIDAITRRYGKIPYVKTSKARADRGGGTWMHPKLGVRFAQWCDIDFAVWCDEQIEKILSGTHVHHDWKKIRHEASSSFKVMNEALRIVREEQGKVSKGHHYSNEARLINWVLSGNFAGLDRDELSKDQLDMLAHLEIKNSVLIARGIPYQDRKILLEQYAIDLKPNNQQPVHEVME